MWVTLFRSVQRSRRCGRGGAIYTMIAQRSSHPMEILLLKHNVLKQEFETAISHAETRMFAAVEFKFLLIPRTFATTIVSKKGECREYNRKEILMKARVIEYLREIQNRYKKNIIFISLGLKFY